MGEAYTGFAQVYDIFMDETPYEEWADLVEQKLREYDGIDWPKDEALLSEASCILDLGCGSGTLTEMLAQRGHDMIGVDLSEEMLELARQKQSEHGTGTMYLCQDMREFELYGTVGAVICMCDSINYLLEEEEVLTCFRLVNNYLYPGGLFLFDFNTVYKYQEVIGDTTIAEDRDECSFIWENYYHPEEEINEYDLTLFVREDSGLYRKYQETHYQRGYTEKQMTELVKAAGMELVEVLDADTKKAPTASSERIRIVAREKGK